MQKLVVSLIFLRLALCQVTPDYDNFESTTMLQSGIQKLIPYPATSQDCNSCITVVETIRQNQGMHAYQLTELVYTTCEGTSLRNLEDFCLTVTADIDGYITQIKENNLNDQQLCDLPIPDCAKFWGN
ncbi:unnamed protein product, partial [Mesorhabditis spiculigera]